MNKAGRAAARINSEANPFRLRASLFHCTPVLERRRRTHWDSASYFRSSPRKFNEYTKRLRKQSLLHNVSEFAEQLFQDEYDQSSARGGSWFRPSFSDDGFRRGKMRNGRSRTWRWVFEFCDGDDDVELGNIFQSAFGGNQYFYWSFTTDDEPQFIIAYISSGGLLSFCFIILNAIIFQAAKETAANVTASARAGMDKTTATVQGKAEEMKTRDPLQKEMATQKKEAKIQEAEREKQGAVQQNKLARHEAAAGGFGHGYTATGDGTTGTGGNHHTAHTAGGAVPGGAGHVGAGHPTGTGRHAI